MRIFWTIEERALRYVDPIERLRYLRTAANRRARYARQAAVVVRVSVAAALLSFGGQLGRSKPVAYPVVPRIEKSPATVPNATPWIVQENESRVLFSNGLTVLRDYETSSRARRYRVYDRESLRVSSETFDRPVGIVFHTTESEILPLEAAQNTGLLRSRESVLEHVRRGRSYNFVIDRFGQVYRIVPEGQIALHAGHSVWGSERKVWIGLNESFIGVSFEAQSAGGFLPSAAQTHAGKLLVEVLRHQYKIPDENCVTHAQVSVNPDNMRIGYHTDWGGNFPFADVGLSNGYNLPLASIELFGFDHDDAFLKATQGALWPGIRVSDEHLASRAARDGITRKEFRTRLQKQFKTLRRQPLD